MRLLSIGSESEVMQNSIFFNNSRIRMDDAGRVCLNDIHKSAGFSKNQIPADWMRLQSAQREIASFIKSSTGKSQNWSKSDIKSAAYIRRSGPDKGTWCAENVALGYAAYLSPDLAVKIRDVFLRYRKGDTSLIPEIVENRARRVDSLREHHRAIGKSVRRNFTNTLKEHGLEKPYDYANCTNEVYKPIMGGTAKQVRVKRSLSKKANLREHMTISELAYTMAAEALAIERISDMNAEGYSECRDETKHASQAIGGAIASDRTNRQSKLI